nr:hypothetical protein [Microbacterium hydrocarbonoxydans]
MLTGSGRRIAGAAVAATASMLLLVGCVPLFPSRPLALQPISVTSIDDRLSWVQCLDHSMQVTYVSAHIREDAGEEREWSVLTAEGVVEDAVEVAPGVPVDLSSTFAGLPVLHSNDIALSSLTGTVTVFLLLSGPEVRAEMKFENIDLKTLAAGKFVYHSGEVSDSPCDMPRD